MKALVNSLSRLVGKYPLPVLIVVVVITFALSFFASQVETSTATTGSRRTRRS